MRGGADVAKCAGLALLVEVVQESVYVADVLARRHVEQQERVHGVDAEAPFLMGPAVVWMTPILWKRPSLVWPGESAGCRVLVLPLNALRSVSIRRWIDRSVRHDHEQRFQDHRGDLCACFF